MNVFQSNFEHRLTEWRDLRKRIKNLEHLDRCVEVDRWWQQVPLISHHLHPNDTENWSDPWTLLSENTYCTLTRAIGICYTLLLSGETDVDLVVATDLNCEEHYLVLVGGVKTILNYWPNTVISNKLEDFSVVKTLSIDSLKQKIK